MYNIRVHYDNGDSITTRINANVSEIVNYYLDKPMYGPATPGKHASGMFSVKAGREAPEQDLSARARCVEFLDGPAGRYGRENTRILRRVYSLSDGFMHRHGLYHRFRFSADVYDRFSPVPVGKNDAAYISGMFD